MPTSFESYCEDYLDLHTGIATEAEIKQAKAGYAQHLKNKYSAAEKSKREYALTKAKDLRKLAKFYGGKALTGTAAQKKWAEDIRQKFLESNVLTDEEKEQLVTCGGFTNSAKFWIENRDVKPEKMTARNIVAQYRGLAELEEKHYDTLARQGEITRKNAARSEIQSYIDSCDFKFKCRFEL